jgi:large subunit ribosomal protein L19
MAKQTDKKAGEAKGAAPVVRKPAVLPAIRSGDVVSVSVRIKEGDKERLQAFEGTVIALRGAGPNRSFTVRKVSRGFGIERIFPVSSPAVAAVEVKRHSKVRRAKLYYLRKKGGREAALREQRLEAKPGPQPVAE